MEDTSPVQCTAPNAAVRAPGAREPLRSKQSQFNPRVLRDDEAHWAGHRRKNPVHGYRAHVATDEAGRLVRSVEITTANVHDGIMLKTVLPPEPGEVYADSAYAADRFMSVIQARGGGSTGSAIPPED